MGYPEPIPVLKGKEADEFLERFENFSLTKEQKEFYREALEIHGNIRIAFVRAKRGKKLVHIRYPGSMNDITVCRFCKNFKSATEEEFDSESCSVCKDWYKLLLFVEQERARHV